MSGSVRRTLPFVLVAIIGAILLVLVAKEPPPRPELPRVAETPPPPPLPAPPVAPVESAATPAAPVATATASAPVETRTTAAAAKVPAEEEGEEAPAGAAEGTLVVKGRVVGPDGQPVRDVRAAVFVDGGGGRKKAPIPRAASSLLFRRSYQKDFGGEARTNHEGAFVVELKAGDHIWGVQACAFIEERGELVSFGKSREEHSSRKEIVLDDIVLAPLTVLTITVRAGGAPVPDATVGLREREASESRGSTSSSSQAKTDASGVVRWRTDAAEIRVSVLARGYAAEHRRVFIEGASPGVEVELQPELEYRGLVLDILGNPVKAKVTAAELDRPSREQSDFVNREGWSWLGVSGTAESDEKGVFRCPGLVAGRRYRLEVTPEDRSIQQGEIEIVPPEGRADFKLGFAGAISVRVEGGPRHGSDLSMIGWSMHLERREGEVWKYVGRDEFEIDRNPKDKILVQRVAVPGTYRVVSEGRHDTPPGRSEPVELATRGQEAAAVLDLTKVRTITGRVVEAGGTPAADVRVSIRGMGWSDRVRTDQKGEFRLDQAPLDAIVLELEKQRYASVRVKVAAEVTTIPEVRLGEREERRLAGRVVDASGRPVAGAEVKFFYTIEEGTKTIAIKSDEDGRYEIDDLPSGATTVTVTRRGMKVVSVTVDATQATVPDVVLRPE